MRWLAALILLSGCATTKPKTSLLLLNCDRVYYYQEEREVSPVPAALAGKLLNFGFLEWAWGLVAGD